MSHESSNDWRPNAPLENLRLRAKILAQIRQFFAERAVMEVDTAVLGRYTITDRHITSLAVPTAAGNYYLQTSPEYAMKRLLASGSGCIYQICKAFRAAENGQRHNPEFTMLEWYRIGFDHQQLMDEIDALLQIVLNTKASQRIAYAELFQQYLNIDIHTCTNSALHAQIHRAGWLNEPAERLDRDTCLQLLMSHGIEPHLGLETPLFVYDFPSSQAALARLNNSSPPMAERFELYIQGIEIANGFHELTDPLEQKQRFVRDQQQRLESGESVPAIDPRLLSALNHGLPDCAGVALGIDRLVMLAAQAQHIDEVIAFSWQRS